MDKNLLIYLFAVLGSFLLTVLIVPLIARFAKQQRIVDDPKTAARKVHAAPIPLLGGTAIFISSFLILFVLRVFHLANFSLIPDRYLFGVFAAGLIIIIGGYLDDRYNLRPSRQILFPVIAALVVIFFGINIGFITNPFGGAASSIFYISSIVGSVIVFFWLMGMMYTAKFLDGLDGLVSGMAVIASLIIFLVSLDWDVTRSATGLWALVLMGSALGFWVYNWQPAKIFLGEGGALFIGFMLGVLSIISGSKITTTLLVVGIPALDVLWVIIQRLFKKESPFSHADRKHLHFQLLSVGLSKRESVLLLYLIALAFGSLAIFSTSSGKVISLALLIILMILLVFFIYLRKRKYGRKQNA